MKKSLISLAVVAGLAASGAASADSKIYGMIDLSLVDADNLGDVTMTSYTSAIGFKGSEDLGGGMKAMYKMEFQVDVANRLNTITDRDQWLGIKTAGMGTIKAGTMSNNYKQMGGKIDPFYRTPVEARRIGMQSSLHSGAGANGGRSTNTIQYTSPKMGGIKLVANRTWGNPFDEALGLGLRYKAKDLMAWFDLLNTQGANSQSATKFGAKYSGVKNIGIGFQMEQVEDVLGAGSDVMFISLTYKIDGNNTAAFTMGDSDNVSGMTLGVWHSLTKQTALYAAYNDQDNAVGADVASLGFGIRKKF